jgi:hypothetical protein
MTDEEVDATGRNRTDGGDAASSSAAAARAGDATRRVAYDSDDSIPLVVVRTVARAVGRSPLELDPLFQSVQTDGLDLLFDSELSAPPERLEFDYQGCSVTVTPDEVVVDPGRR